MINYTPKLFLIVGSPASGKDELIRAVSTLGKLHAAIVPKHTTRRWQAGDGDEMICREIIDKNGEYILNPNYHMENCDIQYCNYGTQYGVRSTEIWDGLRAGIHQVLVVSNVNALNALKRIFGGLAIALYIFSDVSKEQYIQNEIRKLKRKGLSEDTISEEYMRKREENFDMAWNLYVDNFMLFDHVFIFAGRDEDLYDQIFRLFRYYENR